MTKKAKFPETSIGKTKYTSLRGPIMWRSSYSYSFHHTEADPILALNRARKSLDHWRSTLNDQWNIHGLVASNGYGLDGLPWATSHYSFHLVLWHIPLALSGQRYFAHNASLTFWPKYPIPFNLPFFTPKAMGTIQGAYIKGSDREEDVEEEEEMFTFVVDTGEDFLSWCCFVFWGIQIWGKKKTVHTLIKHCN